MLQVGRDFNSVRLVNRTFQINPEACIVAVVSLAGDVEMTGHFAWNERYLVQPQGVRTSVREPIVLKGAPLENPLAPRQTELPLRPSTCGPKNLQSHVAALWGSHEELPVIAKWLGPEQPPETEQSRSRHPGLEQGVCGAALRCAIAVVSYSRLVEPARISRRCPHESLGIEFPAIKRHGGTTSNWIVTFVPNPA